MRRVLRFSIKTRRRLNQPPCRPAKHRPQSLAGLLTVLSGLARMSWSTKTRNRSTQTHTTFSLAIRPLPSIRPVSCHSLLANHTRPFHLRPWTLNLLHRTFSKAPVRMRPFSKVLSTFHNMPLQHARQRHRARSNTGSSNSEPASCQCSGQH